VQDQEAPISSFTPSPSPESWCSAHADSKAAKAAARRCSFVAKRKLLQMIATADAECLWWGYWRGIEPHLHALAQSLKERLALG